MIICQDLVYTYPKSNDGLSGFSCDGEMLAGGTICGVLGKNGAGKTTLMNIFCGALRSRPKQCSVHGFDPRDRSAAMLQDIAVLPEECYFPSISVRAFEKSWAPFYPKYDAQIFRSLCQALGCPEGKLLTQMSLGQKKKVMLAFIIATRAKLLILDEPTNGLDIPSKILFRQLIRKHMLATQCALISTHQIKDIEGIIDSIMIIENGKLVLSASLSLINKLFITEEKVSVVPPLALLSVPDTGGYVILRRRADGDAEDRSVDLELFFTAAVQDSTAAAIIKICSECGVDGSGNSSSHNSTSNGIISQGQFCNREIRERT